MTRTTGRMQAVLAAVLMLTLTATAASAQTAAVPPPAGAGPAAQSQPVAQPAPPAAEDDPNAWSFSASVYGYFLPEESDYVQPTVTADRGWLHLEARYNYEDMKTGSAWLGYNFSGGQTLSWELTPMIGAVVGNTDGVAPGYKGLLSWKAVQFYTEGEYVFAAGESGPSFFYSWSELTVAPTGWFRAGLVEQRTHVSQSEREINLGILVGFTRGAWDVAAYAFHTDDARPGIVLAASVGF